MCLRGECRRKQLRLPPSLRAWGDLRHLYQRHYARRPQGLAGALSDLGMTFQGREHSGLCDARNTALLAARMTRDGCGVGVTKTCGDGDDVHPKLRANLDSLSAAGVKSPVNGD